MELRPAELLTVAFSTDEQAVFEDTFIRATQMRRLS